MMINQTSKVCHTVPCITVQLNLETISCRSALSDVYKHTFYYYVASVGITSLNTPMILQVVTAEASMKQDLAPKQKVFLDKAGYF